MTNYTVRVTRKTVYGKDLLYPFNVSAHKFAIFAGKKTLSNSDINRIKSLGFTVEVVAEQTGGVLEVL